MTGSQPVPADDGELAGADVHLHLAAWLCGLHDLIPSDSAALLENIPAAAVALIPGSVHAAISVIADGRVRTLASTDSVVEALDQLQERRGQGPYFELPWEFRTRRTDDLRNERRWPEFSNAVGAAIPIRSVLWCQLHTDYGAGAVVLTLCAPTPAAFTAETERLGRIFGCHLGLVLDRAHREQQFRAAVNNHEVMGMAKGILMQRFRLDSDGASGLLTRMSRQVKKSETTVARDVITGVPPVGG